MILNHSTRNIGIMWTMLLTTLLVFPALSYAQTEVTEYNYYNPKQKKQKDTTTIKEPKYKSLPPSVFLTFHGGVQGTYDSQHFFNYQMPIFGFKVGTMKNTGWFLGMMTNFNFKGIFNTFQSEPTTISKQKQTYIEGCVGLTGRYCKPVSFHFGFGYFYNTLNMRNENDTWGHMIDNIKHGPLLTAGFMFHIHSFVLSIEVSSNYNIAFLEKPFHFQAERVGLGAKAGIGFCIPRKKKQKKDESEMNRDFEDSFSKDLRKQVPISLAPASNTGLNAMLYAVK